MTQAQMMEADQCILLSENDEITGSLSKVASHKFTPATPRGALHRAFSVFMFDEKSGDLLLQKRAASKVTFPNVWTNTCCSHPLTGLSPDEVDGPAATACGDVKGVKFAAVRKLEQELGMPKKWLTGKCGVLKNLKFLTRMHYWAADTVTWGKKSEWGEHEIDYVLVVTVDRKAADKAMVPNPDEVGGVKWVGREELGPMIDDKSNGMIWSPWFVLIARRWLLSRGGWWDDLEETMRSGSRHEDWGSIHRFDPPKAHMGGGGNAGPWLGELKGGDAKEKIVGDASKKQGGYGKLKTHKESKLSQLSRFDEVFSALTLMYIKPLTSNLESPEVVEKFNAENLAFCDKILSKVSRSFAAVIRQLPPCMLVDVMIFYLVLRALDTVEDDMTAFESNDVKIAHLLDFTNTALGDANWNMEGVGEADERRLLVEFPKCHDVFKSLNDKSRSVIVDITGRMAAGMAEFVKKDLGEGTKDVREYNRYCHFVAGLVGEGLSRLFASSSLESDSLAAELHLSDQMGLFLQKTNIIRDYLEDFVDGRAFWPKEIWGKYALEGGKRSGLGYFVDQTDETVRKQSRLLLNELVTDALELAPDCLAYLSLLNCEEVFRFCAIPQVMAIATLAKCYDNLDVFTGVVKIRKGLSCKLILSTNDVDGVHATFNRFAREIISRTEAIVEEDGHYDRHLVKRTIRACDNILSLTKGEGLSNTVARAVKMLNVIVPLVLAFCLEHLWRANRTGDGFSRIEGGVLPKLTNGTDVCVLAAAVCCIVYCFCFFGIATVIEVGEEDSNGKDSLSKPKKSLVKASSSNGLSASAN